MSDTANKNEASGALRVLSVALRSESEPERLAALQRLEVPPPGGDAGSILFGLDLLIDAMGDESYRVRSAAVQVALRWPDRTLLAERMVAALGEPDNVGRRNAAVEAVEALGAVALEPLLRALSVQPPHRKVLVDALAALFPTAAAEEARALPALLHGLRDADPNVRAAAAEGLGRLPTAAVVPALQQALEEDADLLVRLAALGGLNQRRVALPMALLRPLLDQSVLRPAALLALGQSRDAAALPFLLAGLLDRGRGAREAAMIGLVRLQAGLSGADELAFEAGVLGLSELAVRSMMRALLEAAPEARAAAATLLGRCKRTEVIRPLVLALMDQHAEVGAAAGRALQHAGAAALEALCDLLPELDGGGRRALFSFLADAGALCAGPGAEAPLRERVLALIHDGLSDRDAAAAEAAEQALMAWAAGDGAP